MTEVGDVRTAVRSLGEQVLAEKSAKMAQMEEMDRRCARRREWVNGCHLSRSRFVFLNFRVVRLESIWKRRPCMHGRGGRVHF